MLAGVKPFRPHAEQARYFRSESRFNVVAATRRGGKSILARRRLAAKALAFAREDLLDPLMVIAAPTFPQVRRLHWEPLKATIPSYAIRDVRETDLSIRLVNGLRIELHGMDKPERVEGTAILHALLDETADMKPRAWTLSLRPSLSTEGAEGTADFIGKPRGRGFYYDLWRRAHTLPGWSAFHWDCYGILDDAEIAAAKAELSELEFAQEYLAEWISFEGRAYYPFDERVHAAIALDYDPVLPLCLSFDFNVSPGTAVVIQEQSVTRMGYRLPPIFRDRFTAVIDEVWIADNSNTRLVCRQIVQRWGRHAGEVRCYGDPTGGNRGSAKLDGSDWDIVRAELEPVFGSRLSFRVARAPSGETPRINALNALLLGADDRARFAIDPWRCPRTVQDLLNVTRLPGGKLDKKRDTMATHLTDELGYYAETEHPTTKRLVTYEEL